MADTFEVKEGIRRWLKRSTPQSWFYSGMLDGLRSCTATGQTYGLHNKTDEFAFNLWHSMDAYNWLRRDCESCYGELWVSAITEMVQEPMGKEWIP